MLHFKLSRTLLAFATAVAWGGVSLAGLAGLTGAVGCTKIKEYTTPMFTAPGVGVGLPQLEGWVQDRKTRLADNAKGGIALRLSRAGGVVGTPRIDVVLEPLQAQQSTLDAFLTRNLREMGQLESEGHLRILRVQQESTRIGKVPAYRVRHEYTIGEKASQQVAITQVTTFVVIDGRGIAVSAAGRTELFHPLSGSVEAMMDGLRVVSVVTPAESGSKGGKKGKKGKGTGKGGAGGAADGEPADGDQAGKEPPLPQLQPIDLGTLGGQ